MMNLYKNGIKYGGISTCIPECVDYFADEIIKYSIDIPNNYIEMAEVLSINANCNIKDIKVISNEPTISFDGKISTGKKLMIDIEILINVKYTGMDYTSINSLEQFKTIRAVKVTVPEFFNKEKTCELIRKNKFIANTYIEDIFGELVSKRRVQGNLSVLVDVKLG